MGKFAELVIQQYPEMVKRKTPRKDVSYRVRVLKRKVEGVFIKLLDIREYIVTERRYGFTESGVYFNREELDRLISILQDAKRKHFDD